jgi:hypothetical protein
MPEQPHAPEAKTPFDTSVDEFYDVLNRNTASRTHIAIALASLLEESTTSAINRERYITNWSERYEYDIEGILIDAGAGGDSADEDEASEEIDDMADILSRKLELLSDVTAFLVGSESSTLNFIQREVLLDRAEKFFIAQQMDGVLGDVLGNALAPYVALDAERAALGDDTEARVRRGRYVLNNLGRRSLLQRKRERGLRRNLRQARRMS